MGVHQEETVVEVLTGVMALREVTVHLVMGTLTPLEERPKCHRGFQAP